MAHADLNALLRDLLATAETLLVQQGEFLPIGAIMLPSGEIHHVDTLLGDEQGSSPRIRALTDFFQKEAAEGRLRAAGLAYDVLTCPPGSDRKQDAICLSLEHHLGEAVDVFRPYVKTEDGELEFEQVFATRGRQKFFLDGAP